MKVKIISIVLAFWVLADAWAQHPSSDHITIGAKLPRISLMEMVTHHSIPSNPESLNDKAIILDFGRTTCVPCIRSLPQIDSIQKEFEDELQFFFVTDEPREVVERFLNNNPIGKRMKIPVISEDSILRNIFPYLSSPHEVWIDKNRIIRAFTDHHYITSENVRSLVNGDAINWPVKWDFPYDYAKSMIAFNRANITAFMEPDQWQSAVITGYTRGVQPRMGTLVDSTSKRVRVFAVNKSIIRMYSRLFEKHWLFSLVPSRVIVNSGKSNRYFHSEQFGMKAAWDEENTYCYEMTFPFDLTKTERSQRILQQLNWYFGIDVELRTQPMDCWILKNVNPEKKLELHQEDKAEQIANKGLSLFNLYNTLNQKYGHAPVIDETFASNLYRSFFKFEISRADLTSLELLRDKLKAYGITIDIERRDVDVLVITEK